MPDNPLYRVSRLKHAYQGRTVLSIDTLEIAPASIVGLIGPNGSGKSTLLKLLAFVERPAEGRISFKGRPAAPFDENVRFQVCLLTQEPYLMKRTVYQNIAYGLKLRGRGNIGAAEIRPGQPGAAIAKPSDIVEVIADVAVAGPDGAGVGLTAAGQPFDRLLAQEVEGDLEVEFIVEPFGEAAHLGPQLPALAQKIRLWIDLFQVFGDDPPAHQAGAVGFDHHRKVAGG